MDAAHLPPAACQSDLAELTLAAVRSLLTALELRDAYTLAHCQRVARIACDLASSLGLSELACQEIYLAGILHDIGKLGIPEAVLGKTGPLSNDEFKLIQRHPEQGYLLVEPLTPLQCALPGILYHHERPDGRGYPHGLSGEGIPIMARVLAVADAYDAMTSRRSYRQPQPPAEVLARLVAGSGYQWDAAIVRCFEQTVRDRTTAERAPQTLLGSIDPQDSPVGYVHQAVMAVSH